MHGGFARPPRRLISGKQRIKKEGFRPPLNWIYTNSILKHDIEHSIFFVPAKLSEARRTGGTRERNEAKPGRKRCCANDML